MSAQPAPHSSADTIEATPLRSHFFSGYGRVIALIASLTILQAAVASLTLIIALKLRASGASSLSMGLVGACFAGGLFIGSLSAPMEIRRIGHIRAYTLFAATGIVIALSYTLSVTVAAWAFLQFLMGVCISGLWAAGDGWIAAAAPPHKRGAIVSFYHVVNKLGAIVGPFIIVGLNNDMSGFLLVAALLALAILPIATTRSPQPETTEKQPFGPAKIIVLAPAAAWGAFTAGLVNTAVGQLYPVYVESLTGADPLALSAQFNAALLAGSMVALWPMGLLSDKIDRRLVIAGAGVAGSIPAFVMALFGGGLPHWFLLSCVAIYGAGALSHYAIAVAHAADRTDPSQTSSMMAGMLMIWSAGSIIGPLLGGAVMSLGLGPRGLFIYAGLGMAMLSAVMVMRARTHDATPEDEKEPFAPAPTTSLAVVDLDTRGEGEQLDLFADADGAA